MQLNSDVLKRITYLTGSADVARNLSDVPALVPFDKRVTDFLNEVSMILMKDSRSKAYSDVMTFAFWIRKGSLMKLKERFNKEYVIHLGKGVVFHIAPSNVPVNFAYSLVSGLLCGNANVVRVSSKDFPQVEIIVDAFNRVLNNREELRPYVLCVRYERDKDINDLLSSFADVRIVWGGDRTIAELRKSKIPPRSSEITFADRYSLAVIDSDSYLAIVDKKRVAKDFYNDTFFSDQNACTSPRVVIWTGSSIAEAKDVFWKTEHELVEEKYSFQPIMGVNKLTSSYLIAASGTDAKVEAHEDNLIVRVLVQEVTDTLIDYKSNSGYFFEYDCKNIMDLVSLCNDKRCQTIAYIGDRDVFLPLIENGVKGIDRIVPIGRTMDFDLIWDGHNLPSLLTRRVGIM